MEAQEHEVRSADGRRLFVREFGPDGGDLVVFHNGTPGTRHLFERDLEAGAARGLRHACYSRPGYEGSDRQPGRSFADCAADTAAVADALGVRRFHVVGVSGGGPHALSCAALLPDRVISATTIATFGVRTGRTAEWMVGTGPKNLEEFDALDAGDAALERYIRDAVVEWGEIRTVDDILEVFEGFLCAADRECLTDAYLEYGLRSCARIARDEIWGWFDDDKAIAGDWGFDLASISVPVSVWHGRSDLIVPVGEGEWVAAQVPTATDVHLLEGEGHCSLMARHYEHVLDGLKAHVA